MRAFIVLIAMTLTTSAFAGGSWKLNCTSDTGISFSSDNGLGQITYLTENLDASIENYDLGLSSGVPTVSWLGSQKILSEKYENSCNSDVASTIFEQTAEIKSADGLTSSTVNVICREDIQTNSTAVDDECLSGL